MTTMQERRRLRGHDIGLWWGNRVALDGRDRDLSALSMTSLRHSEAWEMCVTAVMIWSECSAIGRTSFLVLLSHLSRPVPSNILSRTTTSRESIC